MYSPRQCVVILGHFGCVFRGILKVPGEKIELAVAVKTLRSFTGYIYLAKQTLSKLQWSGYPFFGPLCRSEQ